MDQEMWCLSIWKDLDNFREKVDEKISKYEQQLKACQARNEIVTRLGQEEKLKEELTRKLAELNGKGEEVDKVCNTLSRLTITENDQQRLDNAKLSYEVVKELTGIRLDFSAPPNIMKGYIKNEQRKQLLPFEMEMNSDALWDLMQSASDTILFDKENYNPN